MSPFHKLSRARACSTIHGSKSTCASGGLLSGLMDDSVAVSTYKTVACCMERVKVLRATSLAGHQK